MKTPANRNKIAGYAALLSARLSEKLIELGQLTKWHSTRLDEVGGTVRDLYKELEKIMDLADVHLPKTQMPPAEFDIDVVEPAPEQKAAAVPDIVQSIMDAVNKKIGVLIPVESFLFSTQRGAQIFSMPGFLGGEFRGTNSGRLCRRADNKRSFPSKVVLRGLENGTILVKESWYNEPAQEDLRDYVENTFHAI